MHYSFPPEVELAVKSLEIFRSWPDYVGRDGDFRQTGFVRIVPGERARRASRRTSRCSARTAWTRSVVDARELAEIVPDWNVDDVPLAAWEPDSGYGDGAGVASDFLARAREMGVVVPVADARRPVSGVEAAASRASSTDRGDDRGAGRRRGDRPVEPAAVRRRRLRPADRERVPPGGDPEEPGRACASRGPACIDGITTTYFRSEVGGLTLVGDFYGTRGARSRRLPAVARRRTRSRAWSSASRARVPTLADAGIWRGVTGVYDMSPDFAAAARRGAGHRAASTSRAGFSGMGFKISPAVGLVRVGAAARRARDDGGHHARSRPTASRRAQPIKAECEYGDEEPAAYRS